jgi:hypothetical protein
VTSSGRRLRLATASGDSAAGLTCEVPAVPVMAGGGPDPVLSPLGPEFAGLTTSGEHTGSLYEILLRPTGGQGPAHGCVTGCPS